MEVDSPKPGFFTSDSEIKPWLTFTALMRGGWGGEVGEEMGQAQVVALCPTGIGSDWQAFLGDLAAALIPVC